MRPLASFGLADAGLDLRKELESNKVLKAAGNVPKNGFSQKALYRLFSKLHTSFLWALRIELINFY
jgi:hypothetical protein